MSRMSQMVALSPVGVIVAVIAADLGFGRVWWCWTWSRSRRCWRRAF